MFGQVVDEFIDQSVDLIGRENYFDAFKILFPLIKRSFYLKNRFPEPTVPFLKIHQKLLGTFNSFESLIEAPELESKIQKKIISLITLSYVLVDDDLEKDIILKQSLTIEGQKKLGDLFKTLSFNFTSKKHEQFVRSLEFVSSGDVKINYSPSTIFVELLSWRMHLTNHISRVMDLALSTQISSRLKEQLLSLEIEKDKDHQKLVELALNEIKTNRSFKFFVWLYSNHLNIWEQNRDDILEFLDHKGHGVHVHKHASAPSP